MSEDDIKVWVAEGDWGGQIYFCVETELVGERKKVEDAMLFADAICWPCNESDPDSITLILAENLNQLSAALYGGMGGGCYIPGNLWLHKSLRKYRHKISTILELKR